LVSNDKGFNIGKPYVKGAKVVLELVEEEKGKRLRL